MLLRSIIFVALSSIAAGAFADNPASTCQPIRQGRADVKVYRLYWKQFNGGYSLYRDLACETHGSANVYGGVLGNCVYPVLASCRIQLDGNEREITVSGLIQILNTPVAGSKHFTITYHTSPTSGGTSSDTGEAGNALAYSFDPNVSKLGVTLQSKIDSYRPGQPLRDAVIVEAEFTDQEITHAP